MDSRIYVYTQKWENCTEFLNTKCAVNSGKLRIVAKIAWIDKSVKIVLHNFAIFWWH